MKRIEATVSSTAIDAHGEVMTRGALESEVALFKRNYISMGVEHDPRIPPVGRFIDAWIEDRDDGISVLKAVAELFEPGDTLPATADKTIAQPAYSDGQLIVGYDRTYESSEDSLDINAIADRFGSAPQFEMKKAVDPLSILMIGGAFVLGSIATGFLKQVGADGYLWLKERIVRLIQRQQGKSKEQLLVFEFSVKCGRQCANVQTILSNPDANDIEAFLQRGIHELDVVTRDCFNSVELLSRVVYFFENGRLKFKYAVRTDGFPATLQRG
jgi:hypothetical protein